MICLIAENSVSEDPETINEFIIDVSQQVLDDLRTRLRLTRFSEPIVGTNFNFGFNGDYLKKLVDYWLNKYDWKSQETYLNQYNHFKTQINGINLHYIHVKPSKPTKTVIPIMVKS